MFVSAFNSARSGLAAAEFAIGIYAHNVANANTDGFVSSQPVFEAVPLDPTGGGVRVADVSPAQGQQAPPRSDGTLPPSDTDIARNLIDTTLAGTLFRANLEVIRTSDELLDELFNLRRR